MPLTTGTRLGSYEILGLLGAGGMGEVYRARDAKLGRDVAIKVLPASFAKDADRLARFEREAKTLAALNHPNIASIHGLEESGGVRALVMELVDGEDLAQRISRGAIPIDEALPIATQIADALEAAHEQGIVHRDLKPANIKIRPDGTVKVLDFGLAKGGGAGESGGAGREDLSHSPTLTMRGTQMGMIIGTAAYMAPEQAKGRTVDKRADIWAFGVVLFEMLTGQRAFTGDDVSEIIASVLKDAPDFGALPAATPPRVRRILERCLERDPRLRLRDIGEARVELSKIASGASDTMPSTVSMPAARAAGLRWMPWAVAVVAIAGAAIATLRPAPSAVTSSLELAIGPPEGRDFQIGSNSGNVTISPDGTMVAFVAMGTDGSNEAMLWVRPIGRDEPRVISGTKGAFYPFWAPDSRSLAFFADRKLHTVEIAGGLPQVVADAQQGRGGCWGDDGRILFTPMGGGAVASVAATGGAITPITKHNNTRGENANYWPTCLPGSKHFLYFARSTQPENNGVYFAGVDGKSEPVKVVSSLSSALYVPQSSGQPGYLLWARDQDLLAQPFDAESGRTRGQAAKIASGVLVGESQRSLMADASRTGTLVWATARIEQLQFEWFDRSGRRVSTIAVEPGMVYSPLLSPDERSLAFSRADKGGADIMIHDFAGGTTRRVSTEPGYNQNPAWMPDGRRLLYSTDRNLKRVMLDGSGPAVSIAAQADADRPVVTPDGRYMVVPLGGPTPGRALHAIELVPPYTDTQLLSTQGEQNNVHVSPDGRWLLWGDVDAGRQETYLTRFLVDGGKPRLGTQRIPIALGGSVPIGWRGDGREIFYLDKSRDVTAVPITLQGDNATLGTPTKLFSLPYVSGDLGPPAVSRDGSRFIVSEKPFVRGQTIRVLTNWTARLNGAQ
jgi:dipeptidyl aminopeptidase/acylaminoacyl peptidase